MWTFGSQKALADFTGKVKKKKQTMSSLCG